MVRSALRAAALLLALAPIALAQGPPTDDERMFVLVVGVEDYADAEITDLAFAEDDAQAVHDFFAKDPRSPTRASRVKLLRGKQATRRGVLRAIRDHLIRQAVGPKDTAVLFFAGHGFSDANGVYLATVDTTLSDLEYTSIRQETLQKEWGKIGAGHRLLLLDACRSGGLKGLRGFGGVGKRMLPSIPEAQRSSVVVAATQANQLSREDQRAGHGVFTACLLEGLRGRADTSRDGAVSLGELAKHLEARVPQRARAAGGNQTPAIRFAGAERLARSLVLSSGQARPVETGGAQLARVAAEREAAEKERQRAELRLRLAEARLEKLKDSTATERQRAEAEARAAAQALARAKLTEARLHAEEQKRIEAERRAAKAEAENAELRRQLAELQGQKAEAERARRAAAEARERERQLAGRSRAPASSGRGDSALVARAKRLPGFRYVDTKAFRCGDQGFEIARFEHAATGLLFHLIPGGTYARGSQRTYFSDEQPLRRVTIQPFLICATECTQDAWGRLVSAPASFKGSQRAVAKVSWREVQGFCRQAGLRLPSEAEWEYACRGGSSGAYCYGGEKAELARYGVFGLGASVTEVGTKLPNAYGLYDVHGNVWEWVQDGYASYSKAPTDGSARDPGGASERASRGGSAGIDADYCRSATRRSGAPDYRGPATGFRPAVSLPPPGAGPTPATAETRYRALVSRAKALQGLRYQDTRTFRCGTQRFEIARFLHEPTGLLFHLIPGGTYVRRGGVKVSVPPFLICATECTYAAWKTIMGSRRSYFEITPRHPVEVGWHKAATFCRKAGLRLPSEAEWEYACRAGSTGRYCYGDDPKQLGRYADYDNNPFSKKRQPSVAGSKLPSAFGLFDMHGNVAEWVQDVFTRGYAGVPVDGSPAPEPKGAWDARRVCRGGRWNSSDKACSATSRDSGEPHGKWEFGGFRPALSLPR